MVLGVFERLEVQGQASNLSIIPSGFCVPPLHGNIDTVESSSTALLSTFYIGFISSIVSICANMQFRRQETPATQPGAWLR